MLTVQKEDDRDELVFGKHFKVWMPEDTASSRRFHAEVTHLYGEVILFNNRYRHRAWNNDHAALV